MMNDRIVVGHLVHRYLFLTGSWIYHQLINLSRYRPIVLTAALENLDQFPLDGVYCYREPFPGSGYPQIVLRKVWEYLTKSKHRFYVEALRQQGARLLHAHFGTEGYYNLSTMGALDVPMITSFYGFDLSRLPTARPHWRKRYRKLFEEGTLFLAEGSHMAQRLVDLGCPANKVVVQHLGVDVGQIQFRPRNKGPGEPVRILLAGSFREKKGIPYGIEAFARASRVKPDMQLTIIGGAKTEKEHQLMEECQQIALREEVGDGVRFLGYIPYSRYIQEMQRAHMFLAPSVTAQDGDTEGGAPVSIIEASAAGMPVVSTRHCDIPEVVLEGNSGILVDERDLDGLTNAILEVAHSPECWREMGEAGRKHIEQEYEVHKQTARLEVIYDGVLDE